MVSSPFYKYNIFYISPPLLRPFLLQRKYGLIRVVVFLEMDNLEFCVVMSVTISAEKRCSARLNVQLLWEDSCLNYVICVCLHIVVSNTYYVVFLFCFSSSFIPHVSSLSGLSNFDCPFSIL